MSDAMWSYSKLCTIILVKLCDSKKVIKIAVSKRSSKDATLFHCFVTDFWEAFEFTFSFSKVDRGPYQLKA